MQTIVFYGKKNNRKAESGGAGVRCEGAEFNSQRRRTETEPSRWNNRT
jgi:hypothetical protein